MLKAVLELTGLFARGCGGFNSVLALVDGNYFALGELRGLLARRLHQLLM
jgi:hypothetical protein